MLTYFPNCSRGLFFEKRRRFAKIRSLRKFSRLQYPYYRRKPGRSRREQGCQIGPS
ncbi:MAG: hypothetical protein PV344_05275 [Anaplasma sp.]|nr:hypothetical protein [Anaplasma sp.]